MKIAPVIEAIENASWEGKNISYCLLQTHQHYNKKVLEVFLKIREIPGCILTRNLSSGLLLLRNTEAFHIVVGL